MAMITWSINDYSKIKCVGLCHSIPHTAAELAKYLDIPKEELNYWVAGINHMAWFLRLEWKGKDAYPLLREKFRDPSVYSAPKAHWAGPDVVRAEIFKAFNYFVTESSVHMSTYVPYFRKRPELIEKFKLNTLTFEQWSEERKKQDGVFREQLSTKEILPIIHSGEYGSIVLHAIETGQPARINANFKNKGLITNLPDGCCVEVPCMIDKEGLHPCYVGDLPPQLAALNRSNVSVQEMAVRGIHEKDKTKIFQAVLLDPLTSAALTIDEIRNMVDELFTAEQDFMQGYK
jgi:alpha-galactosidase